jgi:hypothetical protein
MKLSRSFQLVAQTTTQIVALAVVLSVATVELIAQSTQGGVRGTVTDQTGAAVATAKVSLINDGTNETRSLVTNSEGAYDFTLVVPATYTISAEAPSFKKFSRKNVIVATQEYLTVDLKLEVGSVTESVLVTEEVPLVETANASQGQVLDNQKLVDLPNLGRNPFMMSKLSQNVMNVGPPAYNRMEDQSGSSMISIAGGPVRGNNYLLDGIPITDANNRAIIIPTIEAVQEVKIQSNTYDAEMARTGGGMFNTLMKSGTNEFHGSAYGALRRTSWDANNFFSNAGGIPIADQPNTTWAASLGGPVWIPKVYDGRNRTFFYLAVEHYDDASSDSSFFNSPTALERMGNFSQSFVSPGGPLIQPIDPTTRHPFPNNIIPTSELSPTGLAIASNFAAPVTAPAYYGANDIAVSSSIKARAVQYTAKLDEDFFSWWRSSFSYLQYYSLEPGDTWFNSPSTPSGWRLQRRVNATQLNNFFTIDPTTVLAVRYGFNRFPNYDYNSSQGYNITNLGFSPSYVNSINPALAEFPNIQMTSFYSLGDSGDDDYYSEASNNFGASVDKYIGKHSLKFGFDWRKLKTSGSGINYPTGGYAFNTNTPGTNSYTGYDMADLLLGLPYTRTADNTTTLTDYANYYGLYIQDNFRLTSKITLNYGLRWEHETGIQEIHNGLLVNFNQTVPNVLAPDVIGIQPLGAVEYAGLNGNPTQTGNFDTNKWGPRGGIAYQLDSKTVIRGGYGLFWAPQFALGGPISTLGYSATTNFTGSTNSAGGVVPTLYDPFPGGLIPPTGNSLGVASGIGQDFSLPDPNSKSPRVQQYSVDVQRQLPYGIAAEVGYVGSYSTHMILGAPELNINALNPILLSHGTSYLNQLVPNPYYGHITVGTLAQATVPRYFLELPFSAYGNIDEIFADQNRAKYNSMVVKVQKRLSQGLTFLSTFTWSKNQDESSAGPGNALNGGNQGYPQNPYNMGAEYALANINSPVRWATAISYTLPFGSGKPFLNSSKWMDYVFGGWTYNAVAVYQTGFPLQIYQNDVNGQYGYQAMRPNYVGGVDPAVSGSVESKIYGYFDTAAFSAAPQGTFGNLSRTIPLRGPGQKNWDMSLFKTVTIKERFQAQFRFEALNALNSPLFASPNTNFSSGTFGQVNTQANFSRQLQMGLRFSF